MSNYQKAYGQWAGNPKGTPPDRKRCCAEVYAHGSYISSQCRNKATRGDYCATHHPEAVAARQAKSSYSHHLRNHEEFIKGLRGVDKVLKAIAAGHNDPRTLAKEWLDKQYYLEPPEAPKPKASLPPPPKGNTA